MHIIRSEKMCTDAFFVRYTMKKLITYFSRGELLLWGFSAAAVVTAFLMFDRNNWLTLAASLIGVTSLIFAAKGHPAAQAMAIIFAVLYGVISWQCRYYGEMITYIFMSLPMAAFSLVSWLRNPSENKNEVRVNHLKPAEYAILAGLTVIVTVAFFFILRFFNTANLIPSPISVATSFIAVYFVFRRSPLYAVGYAANDMVLLVLWTLASMEDIRYVSVLVCFAAFLVNDLYGFFNWRRMAQRQSSCQGA